MIDKNKYDPLKEYLKKYQINLSFQMIEKIIGEKLPSSAYKFRAWWANGGHLQANAWLDAGWKVCKVNLGKEIIFKLK